MELTVRQEKINDTLSKIDINNIPNGTVKIELSADMFENGKKYYLVHDIHHRNFYELRLLDNMLSIFNFQYNSEITFYLSTDIDCDNFPINVLDYVHVDKPNLNYKNYYDIFTNFYYVKA